MPPRASFLTASALVAAAVVFRAFPFVWWPGTHFDSDQAIVGLMAKHVSEGRAWPLFYYGQHYMLGVEAYLAAPLMWVMGPTVTALKLPLVLINIAAVLLLLRVLVRDGRLPVWAAMIATLPLAMPAAVVAARTTEANGGNVEPWLYVVLLWVVRHRPFAFGTILGLGMLHREFTAYGAAALLLMDVFALPSISPKRPWVTARMRHWAIVVVAWVAARAVVFSLEPFSSALGPGTRGDDPALLLAVVDTIGGRICFAPETWTARSALLFSDHLPRLMGGIGAPLRDYGVLSGVFSGQPGLGPWVAAVTLVGLTAGSWHWWRHRPAERGDTLSHVAGYLALVGVVSTLVYGFATCSDIRVETLRYNLLGVFVPVGAIAMALKAWPQPAVRAGIGAAVTLWCALNALDVVALTREYARHPLPDHRQALADALVAAGITNATAPFRTAYHVTFLARERVRVAATDFSRIRAYDEEAATARAPAIVDAACEGGRLLPSGQYLCPPIGSVALTR